MNGKHFGIVKIHILVPWNGGKNHNNKQINICVSLTVMIEYLCEFKHNFESLINMIPIVHFINSEKGMIE